MLRPRICNTKGRSRGLRAAAMLALCLGACSCARLESFRGPAKAIPPDKANDPNFSPNSRYPANQYDNDSGRIVGERERSRPRALLASVLHRRKQSGSATNLEPVRDTQASDRTAARLAAKTHNDSAADSPGRIASHPPAEPGHDSEPPGATASIPPISVSLPPVEVSVPPVSVPPVSVPSVSVPPVSVSVPKPNVAIAQAERSPSQTSKPARPDPFAIVQAAHKRLGSLRNYQVELTRQERVAGALQPAETVLLSVRTRPQAVRLEWPSGAHKGREVLFLADADGGMMHVNMADSVVPVPRLSMRPDSPMAMANSRHPINEAGFETILASLESSLAPNGQGRDANAGRATYGGVETVAALGRPCHKFRQARADGEIWLVYLDKKTQMPGLVEATASSGELLERYEFRNLMTNLPDLTTASAFDPNARWGATPSLFSKLAKAAGKPAENLPQ